MTSLKPGNWDFPVEDDWSCKQSGDCCKIPSDVTMTHAEQQLIQEWADANWSLGKLSTLKFTPHEVEGFINLKAHPCPFLDESSGKPICTIRPIRPYNCRRFACLRPDPQREPFRIAQPPVGSPYDQIACVNTRMRLIGSRVARRTYTVIQRRAQVWARKMGWTDSPT